MADPTPETTDPSDVLIAEIRDSLRNGIQPQLNTRRNGELCGVSHIRADHGIAAIKQIKRLVAKIDRLKAVIRSLGGSA